MYPRSDGSIQQSTVIDAILSRRSIRTGYDGERLPGEVVDLIMTCGLAAPSSKNSMPWRLHAVVNRQLLARIANLVIHDKNGGTYVPTDPVTGLPDTRYSSTVVASGETLMSASAGIFVENLGPYSRGIETLVNVNDSARRSALFSYGLEMIGIGAAFENMWLAAGALGYSATLMVDVVVAEKEIAPLLGIHGDLVAALAIGKSTDAPTSPMDRPPMGDMHRGVLHDEDTRGCGPAGEV